MNTLLERFQSFFSQAGSLRLSLKKGRSLASAT